MNQWYNLLMLRTHLSRKGLRLYVIRPCTAATLRGSPASATPAQPYLILHVADAFEPQGIAALRDPALYSRDPSRLIRVSNTDESAMRPH